MIVDLMRNDLSRVCAPGTVRVAELFGLEHYATVHHLVSTVVGDLTPGTDALDLLRASFPGGSITGAPKVRAMEIITELEPSERGVYCGSIGYWSVTGAFDSSIAIRTVVALGGRVYFSAGGGIVADSDPEQEYRETLDKARGMIDALVRSAVILLIDNYDSFVHNLARYVRELGGDAVVRRNDAVTLGEIEALAPSHIILSPGPCSPAEAGISTDLVRHFGPTIPVFGVCLGHQCIGAAYGGDIVRAGRPRHGRTSPVAHDGSSVFAGLPSPIRVARYHSLVIARILSAAFAAGHRGIERRRRDHGGRAPRTSGGRRAVSSRVGGNRVRLRDARSFPAWRALAHGRAPDRRRRRRKRASRAGNDPAVGAPGRRRGRRVRATAGGPG